MTKLRHATLDDVEALVSLRLAMLREAGFLAGAGESDETALVAATRQYLATALSSGDFVAWVAEAGGKIVSTSGLVFFQRPPGPGNLSGREAYVMNMYTVPEWRGQGLARATLREIIASVRRTGARRIWLHATPAGRPVYERVGFVEGHAEMELTW